MKTTSLIFYSCNPTETDKFCLLTGFCISQLWNIKVTFTLFQNNQENYRWLILKVWYNWHFHIKLHFSIYFIWRSETKDIDILYPNWLYHCRLYLSEKQPILKQYEESFSKKSKEVSNSYNKWAFCWNLFNWSTPPPPTHEKTPALTKKRKE